MDSKEKVLKRNPHQGAISKKKKLFNYKLSRDGKAKA